MTGQSKLKRYQTERDFKRALKNSDYGKLLVLYGHDTLICLLHELEGEHKYEECGKIKAAIEAHNKRLSDTLSTL